MIGFSQFYLARCLPPKFAQELIQTAAPAHPGTGCFAIKNVPHQRLDQQAWQRWSTSHGTAPGERHDPTASQASIVVARC